MPQLHEIVRSRLCEAYHGDFNISIENVNKFTITIVGSEQSYFSTNVFNRDNNRLIITIEPEKYGADFVRTASKSSVEQRTVFLSIWEKIGYKNLSVVINGVPVTPSVFLSMEVPWKTFVVRFSKAAFYDPDMDERDEKMVDYIIKCMSLIFSLVKIQIEGFAEGKEIQRLVTTHERNPINKQICLSAKGYRCEACGVLLEELYGPVAKNYIQVHHSTPVASMGDDYVVKPLEDLHPLCPNCHAIAHRRNPPYSIEQIKKMLSVYRDASIDYRMNIAAEPEESYGNQNKEKK